MKKAVFVVAALMVALFLGWRLFEDGIERIIKSREIVGAVQLLASDLRVMVPETEEEVVKMLQYNDDVTASTMRKIARYRIEAGDTPKQAYLWALRLYISAVEDENDKK